VISPEQIRAYAGRYRDRMPEKGIAVALLTPGPADHWPSEIQVSGGAVFPVHWCPTPLAMRMRLRELEAAGRCGILLTSLDSVDGDIGARLVHARILAAGPQDRLKQGWSARELDPRLFRGRYAWLPELMLRVVPQDQRQPAPGAFLTLDHALQQTVPRCLGLDTARPGLPDLLAWLASVDLATVKQGFEPAEWIGLRDHLARSAGPAGVPVWDLADPEDGRSDGARPLSLGLVLGLPGSADDPLPASFAGGLRALLGVDLPTDLRQAWAGAADPAMDHRALSAAARDRVLSLADQFVGRLGLESQVARSVWLRASLTARLAAFARSLEQAVRAEDLPPMRPDLDALAAHRLTQGPLAELARMLARVAWRLSDPLPEVTTPAELAKNYARDLSYLDSALAYLADHGGDVAELAPIAEDLAGRGAAYLQTLEVRARPVLAKLSQPWPQGPDLVGVEDVLSQVVLPLIDRKLNVLLLVMDGLSLPILHRLGEPTGWRTYVPEATGHRMTAAAVLPTVTTVSRTSLLSGALAEGGQREEQTGLEKKCRKSRLFHKADLEGQFQVVQQAIAQTNQHSLVAVVHNAVDDELDGSSQLRRCWKWDEFADLPEILEAAAEAGRVLVVVSDHGHVTAARTAVPRPEHGLTSARSRLGSSAHLAEELVVQGARVLPEGQAVVLTDRGVRYGQGSPACHGGLSLPEIFVPVEMMVPKLFDQVEEFKLPGWKSAPPLEPDWWHLQPKVAAPGSPAGAARDRPQAPPRKPRRSTEQQLSLLDLAERNQSGQPGAKEPQVSNDLAKKVVGSAVMQEQRAFFRQAPDPAQVERFLAALIRAGGCLSVLDVARGLEIDEARALRFASAVINLFTRDGEASVTFERRARLVRANIDMLARQFEVS